MIELDITPPEMVLNGVIESGATKDEVIVTFEDGAKGYLMKGNTVIREIKKRRDILLITAIMLFAQRISLAILSI